MSACRSAQALRLGPNGTKGRGGMSSRSQRKTDCKPPLGVRGPHAVEPDRDQPVERTTGSGVEPEEVVEHEDREGGWVLAPHDMHGDVIRLIAQEQVIAARFHRRQAHLAVGGPGLAKPERPTVACRSRRLRPRPRAARVGSRRSSACESTHSPRSSRYSLAGEVASQSISTSGCSSAERQRWRRHA